MRFYLVFTEQVRERHWSERDTIHGVSLDWAYDASKPSITFERLVSYMALIANKDRMARVFCHENKQWKRMHIGTFNYDDSLFRYVMWFE